MDFSSYDYRVAIGYPTNCLRYWFFHNIHLIASSSSGAFLYGLAFAVTCRTNTTDSRTPDTQGQKQMWYPTLHAVIGKLYVLSHFYNMYVVPAPVPIIFTTSLSVPQQFSHVVCWWARATIDAHVRAHGACAPWDEHHTQRPRRAPTGTLL